MQTGLIGEWTTIRMNVLTSAASSNIPPPANIFETSMYDPASSGFKSSKHFDANIPNSISPCNLHTFTKVLQSRVESVKGLLLMKSTASGNRPARPKRSTIQAKCSTTGLIPYFGSISLNKDSPVSNNPE
ncbi:hypothetical protein F8388_010918 [Cannabis sativa]|uniref:Uncharacterized protein n=1 Tax=Cannabis sativa TaxID=3483 RepID=A0A7J6EED6_CANSA|nr:hypothetical protein F8388_010918 [Cannabis sativa]KAF4396129.1 hypothetical protein G4B88_020766 [Cannabis sativa]